MDGTSHTRCALNTGGGGKDEGGPCVEKTNRMEIIIDEDDTSRLTKNYLDREFLVEILINGNSW